MNSFFERIADLSPEKRALLALRNPLSFAQQRLWLLHQLDPDSPFYNGSIVVYLSGQLVLPAIEQALDEVVRRHGILRAIFPSIDGRPAQIVLPPQQSTLPLIDLRDLPKTRRLSEIRGRATPEAQRPFDIGRGPLMRVYLLHLSDQEHLLLLTIHHLISDLWSSGLLVREVGALYEAFVAGGYSPLRELPIQYADYARLEQQWLQGERDKEQLSYWVKRLSMVPPLLNLPTDHLRPARQSFAGARLKVMMPAELSAKARELARREGVTLFMMMMAVWQLLLSRYAVQEEFCVGTPVAGRGRIELENLIGYFAKTVVMKADLKGGPDFRELLKRVKAEALEAYRRQELPFEKVVEELRLERSLSYNPLFQVLFAWQNTPEESLELVGLSVSLERSETRTSRFDLSLELWEKGEGIAGEIEYSSELFEEATVARLSRQLRELLEGVVSDPGRRLSQLRLMTEMERQQVLVEYNDTKTDRDKRECLQERFAEVAREWPDGVALSRREESVTYGEMEARSNRLARRLARMGVGLETVVGVLADGSAEMVVAMLGVLKAGGAYLPVEPKQPAVRRDEMLRESGVRLVLSGRSSGLRELPGRVSEVVWGDGCEEIEEERGESASVRTGSGNLAYVIYTSGSTGRPKGVMVEHGGVAHLVETVMPVLGRRGREVWTLAHSCGFDFSVWEMWGSLLTGGRLALMADEVVKDVREFLRVLVEEQVTVLNQTPTGASRLMGEVKVRGGAAEVGLKVKVMVCGGEALSWEVGQGMRELGEDVWNFYGPTEATVWAAARRVGEESAWRGWGPVGRPLPDRQIYMLEESGMAEAGLGMRGEIYLGGEGIARGYLGDAGQTAERFRPDPYSKERGRRMYGSGDVGKWSVRGEVEYVGRKDNQVKVRGHRVELGEIEAVLEGHETVSESQVMLEERSAKGVEENGRGGGYGREYLVAYVRAARGKKVEVEKLRRYVRERLPEYMAPAILEEVKEWPRTKNGKIDRESLKRREKKGRREGNEKSVGRKSRSMVWGVVEEIWEEVLCAEEVGERENFFDIGGHSLLATQVISRLRDALGVELRLKSIFEAQTLAEFVVHVESEMREARGAVDLPLQPVPRYEGLPLSFAQEQIFFLDQWIPGAAAYHIPSIVHASGALRVAAIEQSFNELIRRHEILRTGFVMTEGKPVQIIAQAFALILPIVDLSGLSEPQRTSWARKLASLEARRSFELARSPLLRVTLLRLRADEQVIPLIMHHIISDGWSLGVFVQEMGGLYEAYTNGHTARLPDLPIQYADFAIWQRELLQGAKLEEHLSYWRRQLAAPLALLELPTTYPRPSIRSFRGARHQFIIRDLLFDRLKTLARQEGVTLFMLLLSAWQALLARNTGQRDICVGVPVAGRNRAKLEGIIGHFANTLVIRTDLGGDPTFREALRRVRNVVLEAYSYQELPFEKLVEALQPERATNYTPLFQVLFVLQDLPIPELKLSELDLQLQEIDTGTAKFDLTITLMRAGGELNGALEYSTELFDNAAAARLIDGYHQLLESVVDRPAKPLSELSPLTEGQRQQLLIEWNDFSRDYPRCFCVHQLFETQAEKSPDSIAVRFENEQLTYHELNCRANQLARFLNEVGVGPEVCVGIYLERCLDMVVALLAVLKAGGAYLPLDPGYPMERLAWMVEDSQAPVLLTRSRLLERLPTSQARVVCLDKEWERIASQTSRAVSRQVSGDNLAYVIYTSGSTGRPKGSAVYHRGVANLLQWFITDFEISANDCFLLISSSNFDLTQKNFFAPLMTGATLCLSGYRQYDPAGIRQEIHEQGATLLNCTPSAFYPLVEGIEERAQMDLKSLRLVFLGGEPIAVTRLRRWLASAHCQAQMVNTYGPTECTDICAYYLVEEPERFLDRAVPIGKPIYNTQLFILGPHLEPLPVGVVGELCIQGEGVGPGYLNNEELTAEKFVASLYSSIPGRLYRTGDLARYRADGCIELLGRIDHQVKFRGYRIELGEIEAVLSEQAGVREAVVRFWDQGERDEQLVAYFVKEPGVKLNGRELRAYLGRRLPEYMAPSAFVELERLPLTPNGKLDRRALPEPGRRSQIERHELSPVEEIVGNIFAQVLRLEHVGREENFFELGGHSLLATQVISRLRDNFGVEAPLQTLFKAQTVAGLACDIEQLLQREVGLIKPPIVALGRDRPLPLSYAQQRLWLMDQLNPGSSLYNVPFAGRLRGALNVGSLAHSLSEIVRRHEVLRTCFPNEDGHPTQQIAEPHEVVLPFADLSGLKSEEREREALKLTREWAEQILDLSRGPLLLVMLAKLDVEDHVLLLTMHHVVSDAWSIGLLVREFRELYQAYRQGLPSSLPELTAQYADFAVWQRQWLQGEEQERQLSYWREHLAGVEPLDLPTDYPRQAVQSYRGARIAFELSEKTTDGLRCLSRSEGATLFMTLLAAFQVLLGRYAGKQDVAIGTDIANRNHLEIEGLIGFFVNQLVLRTDLSGNPSFRELLGRVRRIVLDAYAHQDLAFEKLVEALSPERDLSRSPLFQVKLILQNTPREELELSELNLSEMGIGERSVKLDLILRVNEIRSGLKGDLEYSADLWESTSMGRILTRFRGLLEQVAADADQRIKEMTLLTKAERRQLISEWNHGSDFSLSALSVIQLFEQGARRYPDALALVFGESRLTYGHLNRRANQVAYLLRELGVGPESRVAVYLERDPEFVTALLGVMKADGAYLPIDITTPAERVAMTLEDAEVSVVLTTVRLRPRLTATWCNVVTLDGDSVELDRQPVTDIQRVGIAHNLAYVIYTSGSTGKPKGVGVEHCQLVNYTEAISRQLGQIKERRFALMSTLAADLGHSALFPSLCGGGELHVISEQMALDPVALTEYFGRRAIEVVKITPSHLAGLSGSEPDSRMLPARILLLGGEALRWGWAMELKQLRPECRLINHYGPTECTVGVTTYEIECDGAAGERNRTVPIGRPLGNCSIYVLEEQMEVSPMGMAGELYLGGAQLARGYLNRPELTAERFVPDQFSSEQGGRLYKTGDCVKWRADGKLEILGRMDNQVKIRGFRVELGEVESILRQHECVRQSVVIAHDAERRGSEKYLVAYVIPGAGTTATAPGLREFLKARLPEPAIPSAFVFLESLPLTANGKIDRGKLLLLCDVQPHLSRDFVPPRTPAEELLAEIFAEVLGVERWGIHDDFFDLGGNSLTAVQVIARIRKIFQINLAPNSLFEAPTVFELAALIARRETQPGLVAAIARLRKQLGQLTPDDLERLLSEKKYEARGDDV